ncbi:PREDICTED: intracellular protein transport protein USO1-like [Nicotiana attenuata]|uniref:intracellular protein transport protein USO1-like n=1 Tax=Nicotiana attenuata TaxID=49451 RepID=UPI000904D099|nr:PREDICTED: intracellular protein transport protein USO1-like [Nicotiana attenuata]
MAEASRWFTSPKALNARQSRSAININEPSPPSSFPPCNTNFPLYVSFSPPVPSPYWLKTSPMYSFLSSFSKELMAKIFKFVPQKEGKSTSTSRLAGGKPSALHEIVPSKFSLKGDFIVENPPDVAGRREHASSYIRSIEEKHLDAVRRECKWAEKVILQIPSRAEASGKQNTTVHHGEFFEMRQSPFREEAGSSVLKPKEDNKRKRSSKNEDTQSQAEPTRRHKKSVVINVDVDSVHQFMDDDGDKMEGSTLVTRTRKSSEAIKPAEIRAPRIEEGTLKEKGDEGPVSPDAVTASQTSGNTPKGASFEAPLPKQSTSGDLPEAMTAGQPSSFLAFSEDTIRDAQNLKTSELGGVPSENAPSRAFDKLKTELRHCEVELRRTSNEEKTLRLLLDKKEEEMKHLRLELTKAREYKSELENQATSVLKKYGLPLPSSEANTSISQLQQKLDMIGQHRGEVDHVRAECNEWKAKKDALVMAKNDALAKAGRIADLEAGLAKAKAEVVEVRAEAKETQAKVDRTVAIYLKDAPDAQLELREVSDREKRRNDFARRRSRRETLEEVHAKGFDLSEEIKQAKVDEADSKFILSSDDDDDVEDDDEEEATEESTLGEEAGPGEATGSGGMPLWSR